MSFSRFPAPPQAADRRLALAAIGAVVGLHVGVIAFLVSAQVVAVAPPLATLSVDLLTPPAPPVEPRVEPPRPKPVTRRPPPALPVPLPTLAAAADSPAPAPVVAPQPPAPALPPPAASPAAPAAPAIQPPPLPTPPRYDADYLDNPAPVYPSLSRRLGEEGKVVLRVFVEADGRPAEVQVKAGSGSVRLDQAAQDVVRRWRFVPARRGDEAVAAWVLVPIVFSLKG